MKSLKRGRTAMAVLAVAAVSAGVAVTVATAADADDTANSCQTTGTYDVCVTHPEKYLDDGDLSIIQKVREYVKATESGDEVHVAIFQWELDGAEDSEALVHDLADAQERGVELNVLLGNPQNADGRWLNKETIALMKKLDISMAKCDHSCLPNSDGDFKGNMHMKFFTFKHGDEVRVAHSSSNFSKGQFHRAQNMVSVKNDKKMYDNYVGYWNRLRATSWTYDGEAWNGGDRTRWGDDKETRAWFVPRTAADPIRANLEALSCDGDHNRVWVVASIFNRAAVLNALNDLNSDGCDVRVIVAQQADGDWVKDNSGIEQVRTLGNSDGVLSQHNKLLMTDADFGGEPRAAVYAGSHNLDTTAVRNSSDGVFEVDRQDVFDIYADYYQDLWELATA